MAMIWGMMEAEYIKRKTWMSPILAKSAPRSEAIRAISLAPAGQAANIAVRRSRILFLDMISAYTISTKKKLAIKMSIGTKGLGSP